MNTFFVKGKLFSKKRNSKLNKFSILQSFRQSWASVIGSYLFFNLYKIEIILNSDYHFFQFSTKIVDFTN